MKILVAIFGKSGSGKDTLLSKFHKKYGGNKVVRLTSRPRRPREEEGDPYFFKTEIELNRDILENIEDFLEVGIFNDWIYATKKEFLKEGLNLGAFDIDTVEQLCYNSDIEIKVIPVFLNCKDKTRVLRQINRDDDLKEVARRLLDEDKRYPDNLEEFCSFKFLTLESENETPVEELLKIIEETSLLFSNKKY